MDEQKINILSDKDDEAFKAAMMNSVLTGLGFIFMDSEGNMKEVIEEIPKTFNDEEKE